MKRTPITGGCYCGQVRYRTSQEPIYQVNCHCANCRRAAGAQSVAWITVRLSDFEFEKGTPRRYRTDTGAWRTFCDLCGTSLTYWRRIRGLARSISRPAAWTARRISHRPKTFFPRRNCPGLV